LNEVAEIYDGPHATPKKTETGPWFLSISSLRDGRLALEESAHLSEEDYVCWTRRVAPCSGDVLFSYETRLGDAALMPDGLRACLGRRMGLLRPVRAEVHPRFLLYSYLAPAFQAEIEKRAVRGATVDRIPLNELGEWPIVIPPLLEQRAIAEVLGALDDKIEATRRLARCCTELAILQGIELLSGSEGPWVSLEQVADVSKGVSYRSDDLVLGGGWLVSLKCVSRIGSFQPEGLKPFSGPAKDVQVVEEGDILVAQTDVTQRAEVIGRPLRVERLGFDGRFVASLDFVIVRPHEELTRELLLVLLSQREFREHALGYCNGTTVLHMNSRAVPGYQFRLPDTGTVTKVTATAQPLLNTADVARREALLLADLRDALLPKLLSGELRVRDADALVGEAM
jgi:type I restriction enzyme S subunit